MLFEVLYDDEDRALVEEHTWSVSRRKNTFYAVTWTEGEGDGAKLRYLHRLLLVTAGHVDHINGNGLDNRRQNLRAATKQENGRNRAKQSNNTSGFKGVSRAGASWRAALETRGAQIHLGCFPTPEEAARAYDRAAMVHFGSFARLNFPDKK